LRACSCPSRGRNPRFTSTPVIAKLAAGKTVYGLINTGDMSLANAREIARAPVDFVYADMEHSPLDFPGLAIFLAGPHRQSGDRREEERAAERRADGALSSRGRSVAVGREAGARHRLDGRHLQRRRYEGSGDDCGQNDAVSADARVDASRADRHPRCLDRGRELRVGRERRGIRTPRRRVAL
jgi:hypothetical protein